MVLPARLPLALRDKVRSLGDGFDGGFPYSECLDPWHRRLALVVLPLVLLSHVNRVAIERSRRAVRPLLQRP